MIASLRRNDRGSGLARNNGGRSAVQQGVGDNIAMAKKKWPDLLKNCAE